MRVTVVGGGSTYTPELVDGLLRRRSQLPLRELVLLDPDPRRCEVLGGFVGRMAAGTGIAVSTTGDLVEGVRGAAFVFSQFRVGGQAVRHADELLARRWNLVGQETTGVGGFAKGLRTIPVALQVQRAVAEHARPDAWLINFTNPAGMVTEALLTHGVGEPPRVIGLCNFPWLLRRRLGVALGVPPETVDLDYVGLNHLAWVRAVRVTGQNGTTEDRTTEAAAAWRAGVDAPFAEQLLDDIGLILNPYLQYFYETAVAVARQTTQPTRAETVAAVEAGLLDRYADPATTYTPDLLAGRGGAYYSEAAASLAADLTLDRAVGGGSRHVVNVLNAGALPGLPDDAVVETTCGVDVAGAVPRPTAPLAPPLRGLANAVKDYERHTIQAAVQGDARAARLALLAHPLCPDATATGPLLEDVLRTNRHLLPRFA